MLKTILLGLLFIASTETFAKSKCELEWNALKAVQSQLRHKSTEYLREKEHKKNNAYQDCRKGKNKNNTSIKSTQYLPSNTPSKHYSVGQARHSFNNSSVKMKGKFTGEKQESWNNYYVRPKDCINPKSTSKFAECLNDRDMQAAKFDLLWADKQ